MSNQPAYIDRPPRIQPTLPVGVVEILAPPKMDNGRQQPLWQLLIPLISIGGYMLVSATGQGSNIAFLIPMMLGVVVSSGVAAYNAWHTRQVVIRKQADYTQRLSELRKNMVADHDRQRAYYEYTYPDVMTVLGIDGKQIDTRAGSRLWERRSSDPDFGSVRIGLGARPSTVVYRVAKADNEENPQMRDAERLASDSRTLFNAPITLALYQTNYDESGKASAATVEVTADEKQPPAPIRHAIGISGKADQTYPFVQSMLANLLAFHSPDDMQLFVVGRHHTETEWEWIKDLPHCRTGKSGLNPTWHFEDTDGKQSDKELDGTANFWKRHVWGELDLRAQRLRDHENGEALNIRLPFMLVVVDLSGVRGNRPESDFENSALHDLESEAAVSLITQQGVALGAAIIFLVPERSKIPSGSQSVIELATTADGRPGLLYAEVGLNSSRYVGEVDEMPPLQTGEVIPEALKQFTKALSGKRVRRSYGADMPVSVNLLDLYRTNTLDGLPILANWKASMDKENADWLEVPLGQFAGSEMGRLKLAANASGVHGMIAGSTGSGKSELLMTFILSLAMMYDPRVVNFVLIDFKGGATFDPFDLLPHRVDKVTNLSPGAVARMFAAINAELNRRQEINRRTGCKDIIEYRRRGYHLTNEEHYPHLCIIIDEFAEMIANNPEYRAQLESITRLGRSLGVNLLLAAQRPSGVSDQMRANIKFRICLRVETREESRELLHRPDASFLPTGLPGRGYLQVGNENLQEIQIAFSGSEYLATDAVPDLISTFAPSDVIAVDDLDNLWKDSDQDLPRVYSLLVNRAVRFSTDLNIPRQRKPWPNPLPRRLTLTDPGAVEFDYLEPSDKNYLSEEAELVGSEGAGIPLSPILAAWLNKTITTWPGIANWETHGVRTAVGIVDNPAQAEVRLLFINLTRGHHAIFGASGWGKTTLLRSMLLGLAASHSPDEMRLYFLDFGGRQLRVLEKLPHTSAYILPTETEKVRRLLRTLEQEIDERSRILSEHGKSSIIEYNDDSAVPKDQRLPAIVVVIDNFGEFRVTFENQLDVLATLIGTGLANGVYFVVTGTQVSSLGKLYNQIPERLTLKLADDTEYASIVGRGARFVDQCPGRGFRAFGRMPLEFQVALSIEETETEAEETTSRLNSLLAVWSHAAGPDHRITGAIEILPDLVFLDEILRLRPARMSDTPEIVLGIDDDSLDPVLITMKQRAHFIVSGGPTSGKTTVLYAMILSLAERYSPQEVGMILIDSQGKLADYGGQKRLDLLPHVLQFCITDPVKFRELPELLKAEYDSDRRRELFVFIDNYDDIGELISGDKASLNLLGNQARRMGTRGLHFIVSGSIMSMRQLDDFTRVVAATRFGLATDLESASSSPFSGKVPISYSSSKLSLPLGRAFLVTAGRVAMLQSAIPYSRTVGSVIEDFDTRIEYLSSLYVHQSRAAWRIQPADTPLTPISVPAPSTPAPVMSVPLVSIPSASKPPETANAKFDMQKCRRKLFEAHNIPLEMLNKIPDTNILEMMKQYGLSPED